MTIDINAIVSAAIAEEVNSHMSGLMQAYANKMGELHARITHLDAHIGHLNARIGSLEAAPVDRHEASDIAKEVFEAEWKRRVNSNDVLSREEVAEIVKELWDEDYKTEVEDIAESAVTDHDFDDQIKRALRDATISIDI